MNDKLSRYNIEVTHDKQMLLFNGLTSKIFPVSYEDYAAIETLMEHLPEFQQMYPNLYQSFKDSGFIIDGDFDELAYIKLQNRRKIFEQRDYHITINPTLDCNLKCWYCSVDAAGTKHNKERMSDEMIEGLKKHIEYLVTEQKANSILLDWFGGEPMMYYDEVIKEVSEAAMKIIKGKNINFLQQMTTNATLLTEERMKEMAQYNLRFFQISIDGNERRQNLIKRFEDKSGTYKTVFNNINRMIELIPDVAINLRVNYDKQTLKTVTDILKDLSPESKGRLTVDFQRVWQITCTDKERQLLLEAREAFKEAGFISKFWAYKPLTFSRCYADSYHHYVINYNGKIFKCTARDYSDKMVIGYLLPSGVIDWNENRMSRYFERATFENEMCEQCNQLPFCMGPCIQKNYESRMKNTPLTCLYKNVEYSLSSYVTDLARSRNLL